VRKRCAAPAQQPKFPFASTPFLKYVGIRLRMKIYIDGKYLDERNAKVSVFDHGLLYGDGIFEGIRIYNGRVFKLKEHIDRLFYSAKAILLNIPLSHAELVKATVETCRKNKLREGYIRLLVTRGVGTLGLNPRTCKKPSVIIIADKIQLYPPAYYQRGLDIITVPTTRNLHSALNPAIKSLNYLNNILAKIEANNGGCEEAVMLNAEGFVAECTGDNLFIVKNGALLTPPLSAGALYGITRQTVIALAEAAGVKVSEPNLTRYDLFNADECFLTGTGAELIPVVKIDGRVIGTGRPGKLTRQLVEKYHALTNASGEPIYK
jgi:branched-chain amino acid aminotransferase